MEQGLVNEQSDGEKHGGDSEADSYACKEAVRETDADKSEEMDKNVESNTKRILPLKDLQKY